jgi:Flp pilus assembly protein TadD
MTGDAQETFEAFRRAESLVAQRRPLDALAVLAPVLEAEQDKSSVHLLAGRAYLISAQLRRAEMAFRRVIELDPTDHYALFALGKTLQRMSRLTEAQTQRTRRRSARSAPGSRSSGTVRARRRPSRRRPRR